MADIASGPETAHTLETTKSNVSGPQITPTPATTKSSKETQDADTGEERRKEALQELHRAVHRVVSFGSEESKNLGQNETQLKKSPRKIDNIIDPLDDLLDPTTLNNVMHALMLGYVVTAGTYSNKKFIDKTSIPGARIALQRRLPVGIVGWQRCLELDRDPPEGVNGVHGIVLTNEFMQAIIVIRGTDLPRAATNCTEESGCRADLCADKKLWDLPEHVISSADMPLWCKHESADHDYVAEAKEFVTNAVSALEGYQILLAGHSLGAGLALLAGADILSRPSLGAGTTVHVVAVSPPPFASHLGEGKLDDRFTLIYNDADPTLWATRHRGGFKGAEPLCYDTQSIHDAAIRACTEECIPAVNENIKPAEFGTVWATGVCDDCYPQTHELGPYLKASRVFKTLQKCAFGLPETDDVTEISSGWRKFSDKLEKEAYEKRSTA